MKLSTLTTTASFSNKLSNLFFASLATTCLSLCLPLTVFGQVDKSGGSVQNSVKGKCTDLVITEITVNDLSGYDKKDGKFLIKLADVGSPDEEYIVSYSRGGKEILYHSDALQAESGVITLGKLKAGMYSNISITRKSDGCVAKFDDEVWVKKPANPSLADTGCGTGNFTYSNCRGTSVSIARENISANEYIYCHASYIGTIGWVNSQCSISSCQKVMCLDFDMDAPTPAYGHSYGDFAFNHEDGNESCGISDLEAERINWIFGNRSGYSNSNVQDAVWCIRGVSSKCNALSDAAIAAVPTAQGSLGDNMEFYHCSDPDLQGFVVEKYVSCDNVTNGGTIAADQSIPSGGDPAAFTNVVSPSGGSGNLEYMWLKSTTIPCPAPGDPSWQQISGANSSTYDSGPLTVSTCFLRCSRRAGCNNWDGESNSVTVTVNEKCTGEITGLRFNEINGGPDISINNGDMFQVGTIFGNYNIEADVTGNSESCKFIVTGPTGGTNIENLLPYNHPTTDVAWQPAAGDYTVTVKLYSQDNAGGVLCDEATFTFSLTEEGDCDCPDNIVTNPSFENGTTGWSWWNGTLTTGNYAAQCGNNAGHFHEGGGNGNGGAYQDITGINVGDELTVTVFAGVHNSSYDANVAIEYYNSSNNYIDGVYQQVNHILPTMELYTLTGVVPSGTAKVRLIFFANQDWIKTDMWCLSVVPGCDNVTDGGQIGSDQVACGVSSFNPAAFTNIQSPSGGSGNLEYMWLKSTTVPCPPPGDPSWQAISGANSATYDSPSISVSTCFMRCSRRAGCSDWDGESNAVSVKLDPSISLTKTSVDVSCYGGSNGSINLTVSGGTSPYTYAWSNGATTKNISGLSAGTYTVTVTDALGCTKTTSKTITQPKALTLSKTQVNVSCNGGNNGSIDLTVVDGTSPYTYAWSNGATSQDISGLSAGTYTVTVTDANSCTKSISATITQPSVLSLSKTVVHATCGGNNGSIDLSVSGGTNPYTYVWSNGATTQDISNLSAGTYTVTVTDNNNCTKSLSATVNNQSGPTVSETHVNVACYGGNTGSIDISVSGGTSPYTYLWSNGATTQDINNLSAGTYTVTVTDANNCSATKATTITQPGSGLSLSRTSTNVSCYGGSNGSINLTVSGGTSPYSYNWSNGATTEDISGLSAGTYTVTVTDNNGCTKTTSKTITQPKSLVLTKTQTNVDCYGGSNGSIDLTVTDGSSPYTYAWSNGATSQDVSGLSAGTYTVTVTDNNGCTKSTAATITQPSALSLSKTVSDATCGNANGSIDLTVSGGSNPYTYAWSNGATIQDISGLAAGTYTVTVTDNHNCTKTLSATVNNISGPSLSETHTEVSCFGGSNGSIDLTVSGGTSPYTYSWSNSATTQDINNLSAGTYTVTVTDANNCTATKSATINQPNSALSLSRTSTNVSCNGGSDGSINLTVTGGTNPYTYAWSNGATTEDISGLSAGTYTVTVTDANGCTKTTSKSISQPSALSLSKTVVDVACYGESTGSINLSVSGGTSPYTYIWSNGATTQDINNLAAGTYTVTVTDANSCTKTTSATVTQPSELDLSATTTNATCGNSNGAIDLTVSGGTNPYTYIWSNGATTQDLSNIQAGTYTVTVTDSNNCTKTLSKNVQNINGPSLSNTHVDVQCHGQSNGSIDLTVTGGTPPIVYLWSNGAITQDINNLAAGTYTVTVTDLYLCIVTTSATITEPPVLTVSETHVDVLCKGESTGSIDLTVSGGTSPYTYAWSNGATTQDISGLSAGTYTVTVTDDHSCTKSVSATIVEPDAALSLSKTKDNVSCYGGSDGAIDLTVSGGTSPYTYAWSNGATTQDISNLSVGTYTVTVTDANNCTKTTSASITQPSELSLSKTVVNATCGYANGSIDLSVSGGSSPYTYAWSNGATTQDINNLSAGTYTVTVTDNHNCTKSLSATVNNTNGPTLSETHVNILCYGEATGSIDLSVSGGTGPFTYVWSNGATTQDINNLMAGTYTATVTDANSCTAVKSATITQQPELVVDLGPDQSVCAFEDYTINSSVSGGTSPYTYNWSTGDVTASITISIGNNQATYTVTVTDANGCTDVDQIVITPDFNYTNGGTIEGSQSNCGPFDPDPFMSISEPSGGNGFGEPEYIWMYSTTSCSPPIINDPDWSPAPGVNNLETYDPGFTTVNTCYIRCARRPGCEIYLGESNILQITINPGVTLSVDVDNVTCMVNPMAQST
ncbi:MAG: SprB repeat-containing protein [Saprospiraceae bacterium]